MSEEQDNKYTTARRGFLKTGLHGLALLTVAGTGYKLFARGQPKKTVWQLDPNKCTQCGNCATYCVLQPSAVKCVHAYAICGYCELCTGYFRPQPNALNTGAENQLCPTGAIKRTFVGDPYYQYSIDETLCTGCGKCVKGCTTFGNGSLFLQVRHDRCVNCNECSISLSCPAGAYRRVPAESPYLLKNKEQAK